MIKQYSSQVQLIESSTLRAHTKRIIENSMKDKLDELKIPLITEKEFDYQSIDLKSQGAKYLKSVKFPRILFNPDTKIIILPCMKTHFFGEYTGAFKLAVGFMERKQRVKMHISRKVPEKVAEMNLAYKPHLILMDARKVFVTGGPKTGKVETPLKILAGTSRLTLDIRGVEIIQSYKERNKLENKNPLEIRTIKRAIELNIDQE